jgi:two-component system, OmpR family, sensor histidine kinase BaeS
LKQSLKAQLSTTILVIVLLTIVVVSFLANIFINRQFTSYVSKQQDLETQIITSTLSQQYTEFTDQWNTDFVHAAGMYALYEGYIVKVYDQEGKIIWDAQAHDMELCHQIMDEISNRMKIEYPGLSGEFSATDYPLVKNDKIIGRVSVSTFGPFFLNENDFQFIHSLNRILISVGMIALVVSVLVGHLLAWRISRPILKTVEITKQIADGNYGVRIVEESNTKELGLLEGSINHLAGSLETMEKLRKQLTEDVAHELRTPITILGSYLEAMTEGIWEATPERLESCSEEVERIGKLVGDLERLARIEGENLKLQKQRVDLYALIDKTIQSFKMELENKNLEIMLQGEHYELLADPDRLKQVIVNLLSNAIKYSKEGARVQFNTFETRDIVGFRVQDTGIGIPQQELPYIFERFYRADKSRNRATGGTGIGLTIVKAIIEAHGGRVSVQSVLNEGTEFTVILPKE